MPVCGTPALRCPAIPLGLVAQLGPRGNDWRTRFARAALRVDRMRPAWLGALIRERTTDATPSSHPGNHASPAH